MSGSSASGVSERPRRGAAGAWVGLSKEVLAAQVGEGALLNLAVVANGLDDADIVVDRAIGGPDFDGSQVHVVKYHDGNRGNQGQIAETSADSSEILSLHFSGKSGEVAQKPWKTSRICSRTPPGGYFHPKHGIDLGTGMLCDGITTSQFDDILGRDRARITRVNLRARSQQFQGLREKTR